MTRSVADHAHAVAALFPDDLTAETVAVTAALGRVLAADVTSPLDLPVFRNSQMDGYAVRAADLVTVPTELPVASVTAAGDAPATLPPGHAIKIMTGAPLPDGADTVVPVEDTKADGSTVRIEHGRSPGEFVRDPGADVHRGELLLPADVTIAARHVAVLAAVGIGDVSVRRKLRVAMLTTGAELVPAGEPLGPGQIYNSNGIALAAAAEANGAEVTSVAHSTDDVATFTTRLDAALAQADVVFTSGGVSMGDFEVVRETLIPRGGWFHHVAMQPGGPQGLTVVDGVPVLSFPGNPVSTLVSFEVFARPVLRRLAGLPTLESQPARLASDLRSPPGKRQFHRGLRTENGVELVSGPGSHLIAAMARADVLIDVPSQVTELPIGADVQVWEL
ncbi:MAG TPA: gephyrin-like molybdotransferase Glp [Aldersonia sp.]